MTPFRSHSRLPALMAGAALVLGACVDDPNQSTAYRSPAPPPPAVAYTPPPVVPYNPPPPAPVVYAPSGAPLYRTTYGLPPQAYGTPPYAQAVVIEAPARLVMVNGQHAVDRNGRAVGGRDLGFQTEQALANVEAALAAAGVGLEHVVKYNVYVVQGQETRPVYEAVQRRWGRRGELPAISMVTVPSLARPDYLVEVDAIAAMAR